MQKHATFLIGEPEYHSEQTMPGLAEEFSKTYNWKISVCKSSPIEERNETNGIVNVFQGLDSLDDTDVLVFYTRFRNQDPAQWKMILDYLEAGKPVVGLRTATHGFRFPADSENACFNTEFGQRLFGTPWKYHNGHSSTSEISVVESRADHPILQGVAKNFSVRSWLYHVLPLPHSCTPLLTGRAVNSEIQEPERIAENPVAWTNFYREGRVFYTSLGHPQDFDNASFRTLVMNGIRWAGGEI